MHVLMNDFYYALIFKVHLSLFAILQGEVVHFEGM